MKRITFPVGKNFSSGTERITPVNILRAQVLTLEYWREDMVLDRINAHIWLDGKLEAVSQLPEEEQTGFELSNKHQELLSFAMQLKGKVMLEPRFQRLYMLTYAAVLQAEEIEDPKPGKTKKPSAVEEKA